MLPENLQKAVFPDDDHVSMGGPSPEAIEISIQHLKKAELPIEKVRDALPPVSLRIPALLGRDIEEHFWRLGEGIGSDYYRIAEGFAKESEGLRGKFEPGTIDWVLDGPGWTKYDLDGKRIGSVAFPDEPVLVFDVETCKAFESCQFPLLCVAMSLTNIYSWLSPKFLSGHERAERLIRFGQRTSDPQLLIGHNVSFDRARIMEEYQDALNFDLDQIVRNARRFLDTLSLHSAVSGISSQQRITWTKYKKERNQGAEDDQVIEDEDDGRHLEWCKKGSMANLVDVVHLHCDGLPVDKGPRELLLKEDDPEVIRSNLSLIFDYCLNDVAATAKLYHSIWPKFLTKCPHPVTFTAMLEMTGCALPVDGRWQAYVEKCEGMLEDAKVNLEKELVQLADRIVAEGQQDDAWKSDPWLSKLDWTPVPARYTQAKYKKDGSFAKGGEPRPIGLERLFGMPMWYRKLWEPKKQAIELTTKARIVPYLLRMSWSGAPVHFIPSAGWCYRIKLDTHTEQAEGDVITDEEGLKYKRVPHGKEQGANVGCLLSKDYLAAFEKGILETDETAIVKAVLALNSQFSFWTGYRERIKDQLVIYQDDEPGITKNPNQGKIGVILPQTIPMGTVTRRAVESTWMTASNPKPNLVGSELKSLVSPPEGWCLVGADVDSQELWIASLLGDSQFSLPGSTAISWMTLQGTKSDGSDLHSRTARLLGLTRDAAKIFTYGRIYGAGASYAAQLLQKGDPRLAGREAADKARQLYHATKGRRIGVNGSGGSGDGGDSFYVGGTESFMFNSLERIARSPVSRTPALSAAISDALLSTTVKVHPIIIKSISISIIGCPVGGLFDESHQLGSPIVRRRLPPHASGGHAVPLPSPLHPCPPLPHHP